jgi:DMSO/TMAO reductase YedYZ heme-binding membrane subunit
MKKLIARAIAELKTFEDRTKFFGTIQSLKLPLTLSTMKRIVWMLAVVACVYLFIASVISRSYAISASGNLAWGLLVFVMFIYPVSTILPRTKIISQLVLLRKETGILVFVFVLLHAFFFLWKINGWGDIPFHMFKNFSLSTGSLAFLIMIPLTLTSSSWAMKAMGYKAWKILHSTAYLVFVLTALHIATSEWKSEGELEGGPILLLLIYLGLRWFLWWKKKQK